MRATGNVFLWQGRAAFVELACRRKLIGRIFQREVAADVEQVVAEALASRLEDDLEPGTQFFLTRRGSPKGNAAVTMVATRALKEARGFESTARMGEEICQFQFFLKAPFSK